MNPIPLKEPRLERFKSQGDYDIEIVESRCAIIVRQKWLFIWVGNWSMYEQSIYKDKLLTLIEGSWTGFYVEVTGDSDFAKNNKGRRWDIVFEIEEVEHTEHWQIMISKDNARNKCSSSALRQRIQFSLKSLDYNIKHAVDYPRDNRTGHRYTARHEFFHSLEPKLNQDEYNKSNPSFHDTNSLMNLGSQVRSRHLSTFMTALIGMSIQGQSTGYKALSFKLVE